MLDALDREIEARGLNEEVQLSTCGCMGWCEMGPVMAVYPEGVCYRRVQPSDVPEIVAMHLRDGKPVDRLVWNDSAQMKAMSDAHREALRSAAAARNQVGMLPDRLDELIRGYMPSRCILTALELDIFTAVGDGADAVQVGTRINANARAAGMLLNALVALGLLSKSGEEYRNTAESARFFTQGSRDNRRDGLLHIAQVWHRWSTLTGAVRSGKRIPIGRDETPEWTSNFIAAMHGNAKDHADLLVKTLGTSGVRRILDLGGGSGAYSIAFAKACPAQCDILDLPQVIPHTAEYVSRAGVSAQVSLRGGDIRQVDLGSGYDLILMNNIAHAFSEEQNRDIFCRARRALAPNGRIVVRDYILNPDKTGPQRAAVFCLNMLVGTDGGATYSESEYTQWMNDAGFTEILRIPPGNLIVAS